MTGVLRRSRGGAQPRTLDLSEHPDRATGLPQELREGYTVVEVINEGDEGVVFLAEDGTGERVAIKVYDGRIESLDDEALEIIQGLPHEHVVRLHEWGRADGHCYEVMEYVRGETLHDLLNKSRRPMSDWDARQLLRELNEAAAAFYEANVDQGDLAPTNVLVRRKSPLEVCRADFGAADVSGLGVRKARGAATALYNPRSRGFRTRTDDFWAVGMIMLEALNGEHPWAGYDDDQLEFAKDQPTLPIDTVDDEGWQYLLRGLLHKDWETRWTADEVRRWLRGERPPLPGPSDDREVFRFADRRCTDERQLARAMVENPDDALRLMEGQHQIGELEDWLIAIGNTAAADILDQFASRNPGPDFRVARFVTLLDPSLPPVCRGRSVARRHLRGLAAEASRDHGGSASRVVEVMHGDRVLTAFVNHPELKEVERRWIELEREFHYEVSTFRSLLGEPPQTDTYPRAVLLGLAAARGPWPIWIRGYLRMVIGRAGRSSELRSAVGLPEQDPARSDVLRVPVDLFRSVFRPPAKVTQLVALEYQHRAAESVRSRRRREDSVRRRQAEANKAYVRSRIPRYFGWAALYVVGFGLWAANTTFSPTGGFRSAAIALSIYAAAGVVLTGALDWAGSLTGMVLEDRYEQSRWMQRLALLFGSLLIVGHLGGVTLQQVGEREIWAAPVCAVALARGLVVVPDRSQESRSPARYEILLTSMLAWPLAALLGWVSWPVLADTALAYGEAGSVWNWAEIHRTQVGLLVLAGILVYLFVTAPRRLQTRTRPRSGTTSPSITAVVLLLAAVGVFADVSTFSWLLAAGVLAYMATAVQLMVGRRPPRLFWLVAGAFIFWHAGQFWLGGGSGPGDLAGELASLAGASWTMSALRLIGIGVEELI